MTRSDLGLSISLGGRRPLMNTNFRFFVCSVVTYSNINGRLYTVFQELSRRQTLL